MQININLPDKVLWLFFWAGLALVFGAFVPIIGTEAAIYVLIIMVSCLTAVFFSTLFGHPPLVLKIIFLAVSVRIVMLILLKIYSFQNGLDGFFPGDVDALAYHGDAVKALATHSWYEALQGNLSYTIFVAFLYNLLGIDMMIPQLFNLGVSVIIVPLLYELGDRVGGEKAAVTASLLWSLFPSAVFWSISLLKDAFVVFGMVLSSFLVLSLTKAKISVGDLLIGLSGIMIISYMRPQFLLAISIPVLLYLAVQFFRGNSSFLRNCILIVAAVGVFSATSAGDIILQTFDTSTSNEGVERINEIALDGGSGIHIVTLFSPEIRWLVQLPFSIFAPFPWQWFSFSQAIYLMSAFEMLCWYVLYYYMWKNRKDIFDNHTGKMIFLYACSIFFAVSFSLPNIGSIYRYRLAAMAMLLPLIFFTTRKKNKRAGPL
ncbi:hypothetical protein [Jeotgalibacillus campisalis]|uniref:Glycosyltransferase RgtA/B/C/D-like domain-containing protein n=1 Tax=Jeotgalibacillus campisalis TaxID=220754 RepID=A0A0C2R092_9BACL|nr:hypothetical protein [Jeotgalibacillus campisalis]KIL43745.1 hypothetical protein KR50_32650 [Jeotgalibacillus campisalis]